MATRITTINTLSISSLMTVWFLSILFIITTSPIPGAKALGGEIANLNTPLFSQEKHTHRQNVCHRYELFRNGSTQLRDSLSGLQIHPLMAKGDWLEYDDATGLPDEDPGLLAELMDALAERANFTWRQSFGVMEPPENLNRTWTEMLLWGVDHYDINVNAWDQTVQRMELGAAYIEPWFDGSVILIDQIDPPENVDTIIWFNWMFPFEDEVWYLIAFTILLSALVYQFIEYMHDEQEDRPHFQWFSDNFYMSCLNFTQNFEYAPNSVAGRIFGVGMGMWALIMTATYTANLASLFVIEGKPPLIVDSIDQAVSLRIPICTWGLTNSDQFIETRYPKAIRVPKATELEGYEALRRGECGLVAAYKDNWLNHKLMVDYNPDCDLEWVGRTVEPIRAGFAVKTDIGHLCSSLIRDVLNVHMMELVSDGTMARIYAKHRLKLKDHDCDVPDVDDSSRRLIDGQKPPKVERRRNLKGQKPPKVERRRILKGGGSGRGAAAAAVGGDASGPSAKLTLQQMMGTFALHWGSMAIAVIVCITTTYYEKWGCNRKGTILVKNRCHGPIIGRPPKPNTRTAFGRNFAGNGSIRLDTSYREAFDTSYREAFEEKSLSSDTEIPKLKQMQKQMQDSHESVTTNMRNSSCQNQDKVDVSSDMERPNFLQLQKELKQLQKEMPESHGQTTMCTSLSTTSLSTTRTSSCQDQEKDSTSESCNDNDKKNFMHAAHGAATTERRSQSYPEAMECCRSHMEQQGKQQDLYLKVQDLTIQMNTMMAVLHDVRRDQLEQKQKQQPISDS